MMLLWSFSAPLGNLGRALALFFSFCVIVNILLAVPPKMYVSHSLAAYLQRSQAILDCPGVGMSPLSTISDLLSGFSLLEPQKSDPQNGTFISMISQGSQFLTLADYIRITVAMQENISHPGHTPELPIRFDPGSVFYQVSVMRYLGTIHRSLRLLLPLIFGSSLL